MDDHSLVEQGSVGGQEQTTETIPCDEQGCASGLPGHPCWLPGDDEPSDHYCAEHMFENGYCIGCGTFWAGIESFDFGTPRGFCDNCRVEFDDDDDCNDDGSYPWDWEL